MIAKSTAVWVLCRGEVRLLLFSSCGERDVLVTEESSSHATDDDVDGHTDRDQETSCDRVHTREVGDGRGTTQDKHGRDDNVRGQPRKHPLEIKLGGNPLLYRDVPEEHENEMSKFSPTSTNDLEPSVSVWGVEFKLGGKLKGSPRI